MGTEFKDLDTTPTLTLDPFQAADKKETPAVQQVEEPVLDDSILTEEERQTVEAFAKQIDLTNSSLILQYGAGTQKKMADFSESALDNVKSQDLGEVGDYSACYVFWFDRGQISDEDETEIMQSVHSEDITDDLNKISSEDYMAAMGEKIDSGEYRFDVSLPEGMTKEPTADDGALFYRNGQMIGGYKTVHFEKGILPAVHDNRNLIVERLREYVKDQIDLSGFDGEITDESLITAVFTSENEEYSHFILPYGQIGTQYDVWLDTKSLDQATVDTILMGAGLVKNG